MADAASCFRVEPARLASAGSPSAAAGVIEAAAAMDWGSTTDAIADASLIKCGSRIGGGEFGAAVASEVEPLALAVLRSAATVFSESVADTFAIVEADTTSGAGLPSAPTPWGGSI